MKYVVFKYIFFAIAIIMVITASVIVFAGNRKAEDKEKYSNFKIDIDKEINIGICSFDTMNPVLTKNSDIQYLSKLLFRSLINITKDFRIKNDLAEECSKINDKTYIIKLKQDIKWHNGENLDVEDIRFTIENLKKIDTVYFENVKHIQQVELIDNYTIKIYLDEEVEFFKYLLTFPILSKNCYEQGTLKSITETPIGNGIFEIKTISEDEIILESKDRKINIKIYDDMSKVYLNLEKENIDLLNTKNIEYENYTGKLGIESNLASDRKFDYIALNMNNKLLKDIEVRKAINYFIDRKKIIYEVFNNKYIQINFPINPENYLYKEEGDVYDVNEGKKELLENGWQLRNNVWQKDGKKLEFYLLVNSNNKKRCEVAKLIKEELKENGIIINIMEANDYYYNQKLKYKNFDIILTGSILSISPELNTYFGEENICNYKNEEILSILKEIKNIEDEEVLKEKYLIIQEIYKEEIPFISLYVDTNYILYNSKIKGNFSHNWYNLYYNIDNWYIIKN